MNEVISRVGVVAKPAPNHSQFKEWEIAQVILFVKADTKETALALGRKILDREHWEVLHVEICDRLYEERVRTEGGEVWEFYKIAQSQGSAIRVFPKHFGAGSAGIPTIRPPRVTESFIDTVIADIGGKRLDTDEKNRTADYRINEWIFELKDLQEEGLQRKERQQKLAELFAPYAEPGTHFQLDPSVLTALDQRRFFDIISSPIQGQVKSASKQIRKTKDGLGNQGLRGGLIYLNTGYGSFSPDEFGPLVERYVQKDTTQIEALLAISTWSISNGFDSYVFFNPYPKNSPHEVVRQLQNAFSQRFSEALTKMIQGTLAPGTQLANPLTPVAFTVNGLDFAWQPPIAPLPWEEKKGGQILFD